ncbi:RluA family pseudouridine synthase [Candidatus Curtissbacteria bacterium]|nr:RluA family pseudouridine synthase [Candidatus Curtissbacteria bacterium]
MEDFNIIFEDDDILVLDKPAGLVVNKSETIKEKTLQDRLSAYFHLGSSLGIGDRAGVVHRLDRETSGLMVVAKTKPAFENLQKQFKERKVKKEYTALVHGKVLDDRGKIDKPIGRIGSFGKFGVAAGGRESRTVFEVEGRYKIKDDRFNVILNSIQDPDSGQARMTKSRLNYLKNHARDYSLLSVFPKTGRTHQIRVHLKSIGHPVVSDLIYAPAKLLKSDMLWCPRLFLHAKSLEFRHPGTGRQIFFESDLPNDLKDAMLNLTSND